MVQEGSTESLASKKCRPCEGGVPPLSVAEVQEYMRSLQGWRVKEDGKAIRAEYDMKNFVEAVKLIDTIAVVAENEDHHPNIHLTGYRKLAIELSTHAIGGLSENDFILAAKIDQLPKNLRSPGKK